jgi:hypothetical protein
MKYLKSFYFMVESISTYSISNIEDDTFITKYYFTDAEDNRYLVQFKNDKIGTKSKPMVGSSYELCYYVWDEEIGDWNVNKIVNSNVWSVLHTVFGTILNDFIKNKSWINLIRMEGLAKEVEKTFVTQRTKMYLRHFRNNPNPNFRLEYFGGNKINLLINKK